MEQVLDSLDAWFHSHGLKVNTSKTELISFGSRQNCRGLDPVSIRFREDTIHEGPTVRNLGVIFDRHLTWDPHVSALVKKCNGILIGLSHVRHQIPSHLLPTLVNALVLSHVRYCLAVFGNGSEKTYSASKKSWTLRCALFPADVSLTTYRTCGRSWAGLPPVSCTNSTPSASFTKSAAPESQRPFPPSFRWTLYSALEPQGRTLIWPSRAWGLRRVGGAYFLTRCSLTTAYRRRFVTFR